MNSKNKIPPFPRKKVYFEKQSNDRLCGLHCLNNLLQGPYFDIVVLSEIGLELDKIEHELTGVRSQNNVDDDGNFGIQVLTRALNTYGVKIDLLKKRQAISFVEGGKKDIEALIFNSSNHWYAIRKINNIWFNLNSTNELPGPEIISDFYLSAFIQGAEDIGYTNFLVTNLPRLSELNSDFYRNLQPHQMLVPFEDVVNAKEIRLAKKKEKEEEERRKKEEEDKKFKPFSGKGHILDSQFAVNKEENYEEEDEEIKKIMKLSLEEYAQNTQKSLPPEPASGGYSIMVNYNGKIFKRNFNDNDKVRHIVDFVKSQIPTYSPIQLFEVFPRKVYDDENILIKESGMSRNQSLMCKLIN